MYVGSMIGTAADLEAVVVGFLAALGERAPAPAAAPERALPARVLALASDIAARHRDRVADERTAEDVHVAAVIVAAYRLLAGLLPDAELHALLRECWLAGTGGDLLGDSDWADPRLDPLG